MPLWLPTRSLALHLVFVVSLSFLNLVSTIRADAADCTGPHGPCSSIRRGFNLLRSSSRFPPLRRAPPSSCPTACLNHPRLWPRWFGEMPHTKTGPGLFWFPKELRSSSQARGHSFLLGMLQFDPMQHSKLCLAFERRSKKGKTYQR